MAHFKKKWFALKSRKDHLKKDKRKRWKDNVEKFWISVTRYWKKVLQFYIIVAQKVETTVFTKKVTFSN